MNLEKYLTEQKYHSWQSGVVWKITDVGDYLEEMASEAKKAKFTSELKDALSSFKTFQKAYMTLAKKLDSV